MRVKVYRVVQAALMLILISAAYGYDYNPSDFATEVIEYVEGSGLEFMMDPVDFTPYTNDETVKGRPTYDTTGDGWDIPIGDPVPVVPVYAAFRSFELLAIGKGGHLIIKFDHPVENDTKNPCGIDLIVFGNARQEMPAGVVWTNGDPNNTTVEGSVFSEPSKVSVSQNGQTWYTFTEGPFADDFAPTLGRVYDPYNPDTSLGTWNLWWSDPTDPTRPLNPSLTPYFFDGYTVAQMALAYGESAGGTGFDIGQLGLDWIQYVKVENPPQSILIPEIDAFADVAPTAAPADFDCDKDVDNDDFMSFASCSTGPATGPPDPGCEKADFDQDGDVDQEDFGLFQVCISGSGNPADANCMD